MELKECDIILDIKRPRKNECFEVVQGDKDTNVFNINLQKDCDPYPLTGTTVEISFAKADGTTVVQDSTRGVTVADAPNGKIRCELKTNTIAAPGRVRAEVRVLQDAKILTSTSFEFFVKKAIFGDDTIKSSNEWPLLSELLEASKNEASRVSNENTRISNENVRKTNESTRVKDESSRITRFNQMEKAYKESMEFSKEQATLEVTDARLGRKNLGELNREIMDELDNSKLANITTNDFITQLPEVQNGIINIDKIEGNTLQNIIKNGNFSKEPSIATDWTIYNCDYEGRSNGELTLKSKPNLPEMTYFGIYQRNVLARKGDKVYCCGEVVLPREGVLHVGFDSNKKDCPFNVGNWSRFGAISTLIGDSPTVTFYFRPSTTSSGGEVIKFRKLSSINLTAMFGAGKEPTQAWCDANLINYFDGIQHVDSLVLKSTGKNLFNIDSKYTQVSPNTMHEYKNGVLKVWNTDVGTWRSIRTDKPFNMKPNTEYTLRVERKIIKGDPTKCGIIGIKRLNGNNIKDLTPNSSYTTFKTDESGKFYLNFYSAGVNSETSEVEFFNIQLEERTTVTSYEPYKEDSIDITPFINTEETSIKGLPNGVRDIIPSDGIIDRKIKKFTFDGSEPWNLYDQLPNSHR